MIKEQTIRWKPFSDKHKQYIKAALVSRMCVAEGAIRSGKTIDHCIIAAAYLETCRDKIHLASGSSIGNAKLNIGDCNGFGLEHLFRGRCKWGKYKDNDALYISTKTGEKVVIFAGGGKADSYKKILGNSYGLWIATEINEHYDANDSRTSFIKVAFGRQLAAEQPFVLWDLNPCSPAHKIYEDYIDNYLETYTGYLYQHFTIADNLSISEERRKEIEQQYVPGSTWYRRDILGERCIAEGLVYPMWEDAVLEPDFPDLREEYTDYALSIDYGTQNAFSAGLWGKHKDTWYRFAEYYYSGRDTGRQKTDEEYAVDIDALTEPLAGKFNYSTGYKLRTIIDPSAASFIALLKKRGRYKVTQAKNAVEDGIRETATAMQTGKIKIYPCCKSWQKEAAGYVWDNDESIDRPVKVDDHAMDDTRYFVKTMRIVKPKRLAEREPNEDISRFN